MNRCDFCGAVIEPAQSVIDGDRLLCSRCVELFNTCHTCITRTCSFETDPSPEPKVIQKEIRQGNAIFSTHILNPERIRQTCEKGCKCFSAEFGCLRQNCGTCGEWVDGTR